MTLNMILFYLTSKLIGFSGDLHPLLVHFPVGIFSLAVILKLMSLRSANEIYQKPMPFILIISAAAGLLSVITGLIHAYSDEFEGDAFNQHRLSGIAFTVISLVLYISVIKNRKQVENLSWLLGSIVLFITGESGALLTHGYNLLHPKSTDRIELSIENVRGASAYTDIIRPILANKCYSCHSSQKQKGKLRLDTKEYILKGGKNGPIISSDTSKESELITRIHLPLESDDHMPPEGKLQLTEKELKIISWWIKNGADFDKKVSDIPNSTDIISLFTSNDNIAQAVIPDFKVKALNTTTVQTLNKLGISVTPIALNSSLVSVLLNQTEVNSNVLSILKNVQENIVYLNAKKQKWSPELIQFISQCKNLLRLDLSQSNIDDASISKLSALPNLNTLNLTGTQISKSGLAGLKSPTLKFLYVFNTRVLAQDFEEIKSGFPEAQIDSGHYQVPILRSDTTLYTRDEYNKENDIPADKSK